MSRALAVSIVITVAGAALAAQQPAAADQASAPPQAIPQEKIEAQLSEQLKIQVRAFEAVLRSAVESGGRRLQKRAEDEFAAAPLLEFASEPVAIGMPHPDGGLVFYVQVPNLLLTGVQMINRMQRDRPEMNRPIATAPPATAPVVPDPPLFDPNREYSDFVREALIDAMVENSHALRLTDGGELVVVATVTEQIRRNPLDTNRQLILSIKGEHLAAYRQNRLTRDEVKARITDRRF